VDKKIRTLIVDDSILFRTVLSKFVGEDTSIDVVGTAGDAYDARDKILELRPDVLTEKAYPAIPNSCCCRFVLADKCL